MSDGEAFVTFKLLRFAANFGEPFCQRCRSSKVYTLAETPIRWKCAGCRRKFSVTSGTLFHSRKPAIRDYLAVIALFANDVKGTSALQISRNLNINPKSAFVLLPQPGASSSRCMIYDGPAPWRRSGPGAGCGGSSR